MIGGFDLAALPAGPDTPTWQRATEAELAPHKIEDTLAFMFETRLLLRPTEFALTCPQRQSNYDTCWQGLGKHFSPGGR